MRSQRWLAASCLLALVLACGGGEEPAPAAGGEEPGAKGALEPAPEVPLLELSYEGGMIKNPDPTPFVRVYPDGRVLVHYPAYMKRAGDYQLALSDEELAGLVQSFADQQVLTLDSEELNRLASRARAGQEIEVIPEDHGVTTVVQIRADSFTPAGAEAPTLLDIDRRIVARDLPPPEMTRGLELRGLRELSEGVRKLEGLADRPDLTQVEPP